MSTVIQTKRTATFYGPESHQELIDAIEAVTRSATEDGWDLTKTEVTLALRPLSESQAR